MAGSVPGMATRGLVGLMLSYLLALGQAITVEVPPRQKLCFFQVSLAPMLERPSEYERQGVDMCCQRRG